VRRRLVAVAMLLILSAGACSWPVDKHARRLPASRIPPGLRTNPG
jgi:hypothetical protein